MARVGVVSLTPARDDFRRQVLPVGIGWVVAYSVLIMGLIVAIGMFFEWLTGQSMDHGMWVVCMWVGLLSVGAVGGVVTHGGVRLFREAHQKDEEAAKARKPVREETRRFAELLETEYSWVLEMPQLEQKRRGLLWYKQIVDRWGQENARYHELRKSDDRDVIAYELGKVAERMFAIWERRQQLYQWACHYSTDELRAEELYKIERALRQLEAGEAHDAAKFSKEMRDKMKTVES